MTYYPDLSVYTYCMFKAPEGSLNIGWLDDIHDYPKGDVPDAFIEKLWDFCCDPSLSAGGFHRCELCVPIPSAQIMAQRGEKILMLGSEEIRVFGKDGKIYAAPNLIYHYVTEHHYCPPEEFIQAILEGPQPGTSERQELLEKYDLDILPGYGISKAELQEIHDYRERERKNRKKRRQARKNKSD